MHPCKHGSRGLFVQVTLLVARSLAGTRWEKKGCFGWMLDVKSRYDMPAAALSAHKPSEEERGQPACIGTAVSSHFLTAGGP